MSSTTIQSARRSPFRAYTEKEKAAFQLSKENSKGESVRNSSSPLDLFVKVGQCAKPAEYHSYCGPVDLLKDKKDTADDLRTLGVQDFFDPRTLIATRTYYFDLTDPSSKKRIAVRLIFRKRGNEFPHVDMKFFGDSKDVQRYRKAWDHRLKLMTGSEDLVAKNRLLNKYVQFYNEQVKTGLQTFVKNPHSFTLVAIPQRKTSYPHSKPTGSTKAGKIASQLGDGSIPSGSKSPLKRGLPGRSTDVSGWLGRVTKPGLGARKGSRSKPTPGGFSRSKPAPKPALRKANECDPYDALCAQSKLSPTPGPGIHGTQKPKKSGKEYPYTFKPALGKRNVYALESKRYQLALSKFVGKQCKLRFEGQPIKSLNVTVLIEINPKSKTSLGNIQRIIFKHAKTKGGKISESTYRTLFSLIARDIYGAASLKMVQGNTKVSIPVNLVYR